MSEPATCERHQLHRGNELDDDTCDWVVYRSQNNDVFPGAPEFTTHVETATADKPLYCIGCGKQLRHDGTEVEMVPVDSIVASCGPCGDSMDSDIEITDGYTIVIVNPCRRCDGNSQQDAYSRGMYVGKTGRVS